MNSKFGWIIAGTVDMENSTELVSNHTITMSEDIFKRFKAIEELHQADSVSSFLPPDACHMEGFEHNNQDQSSF